MLLVVSQSHKCPNNLACNQILFNKYHYIQLIELLSSTFSFKRSAKISLFQVSSFKLLAITKPQGFSTSWTFSSLSETQWLAAHHQMRHWHLATCEHPLCWTGV